MFQWLRNRWNALFGVLSDEEAYVYLAAHIARQKLGPHPESPDQSVERVDVSKIATVSPFFSGQWWRVAFYDKEENPLGWLATTEDSKIPRKYSSRASCRKACWRFRRDYLPINKWTH